MFSKSSLQILKLLLKYSLPTFTVVAVCTGVAASTNERILTFAEWRAQQVANARQRVDIIATKLTVARTGQNSSTENPEISNLKKDLKVAQNNVLVANELAVEDYFDVYLRHNLKDETAVIRAAKAMNQYEIAELLKVLMKARGEAPPATPIAIQPTKKPNNSNRL